MPISTHIRCQFAKILLIHIALLRGLPLGKVYGHTFSGRMHQKKNFPGRRSVHSLSNNHKRHFFCLTTLSKDHSLVKQ